MNKKLYQLIFYAIRLTYPGMKVSPRWPLAQALHESANFTSRLAVEENNLHGMNHPAKRKTASLGPTDKGFARFRSKYDSIRDYLMWLDYFKLYTDEQLVAHIKTSYATDPNYYTKVARYYNDLASDVVNVPSALVAAGAVGLVGAAVVSAVSDGGKSSSRTW